jgi:hypothetical protein
LAVFDLAPRPNATKLFIKFALSAIFVMNAAWRKYKIQAGKYQKQNS